MLNELEQKIRKAIPELNELGVGCEIYGVDGDFHQFGEKVVVLNHKIETDYTRTDVLDCYTTEHYHNRCFTTKIKYDTYNVSIIGKPIQLNHVLEYCNTLDLTELNKDYKNIYILKEWNLKSNLLSEQSEELIKFINEL